MAWGTKPTVPVKEIKPADYFKPVDSYKIPALEILLFGEPETMKTGFAMSCPQPVYGIDTEGKWPIVQRHFPGKQIFVFDLLEKALDVNADEIDPKIALDELENALTSLKDVQEGTIAFDSMTDIYQWMQAWLEQVATYRSEKTGAPYQFEWGKLNRRWRQLIQRVMAKKNVTKVYTAHPREIFLRKEGTGKYEPATHDTLPFLCHVVLHTYKIPTADIANPVDYFAVIEKCSFEKSYNREMRPVTYDQLVETLRKDLKVEIARPSKTATRK